MPRERNPNRDKSHQIWREHNGKITNRQIAETLGEKEKTISVWKLRDKWNVVLQTDKRSTTNEKKRKSREKEQKEVEPEFSDDGELTPKQRDFVQEYLVDLNATQAAIRAGYSSKNADKIGSQLLGKTRVSEAIQQAMYEREKRIELSQDKVVQQLAKIAFADIRDVVTWNDRGISILPSDQVDGTIIAEISETINDSGITKKVKLSDRMKALLKLYDHMSDEQRLKIEKLKSEIAKAKDKDTDKTIVVDLPEGFDVDE